MRNILIFKLHPGTEQHEAGAGRFRADRGRNPPQDTATHEGLWQGGRKQHGRVHVDVQTEQRCPDPGWPAAQGLHCGE